jgi:hypothetical protein
MQAIDDPEGIALHQDRRQVAEARYLRKHLHMRFIDTGTAQEESTAQRIHRYIVYGHPVESVK